MLIQTPDRTFESNGLQDQGSFNIKTSPAAFAMLSSGLYTNKIKAVLREIGCNALDAHKMINQEHVPIEVKLPNNLDPQFYIKDFGPGLTHEQIMKLYTTYFESSKQGSDDFIGGFGVGSKSPFAYTDTFTVESRHNGMKRLYTAYVGSNGIPAIAKMMEEETTEPNGLTVGFPVKASDVPAFEKETVLVFSWFDPRPNVLGSFLDWGRVDAKEQLGQVTVFDNGAVPGNHGSPVLKMGGVAYPMGDFWSEYHQTFGKPCDPVVGALRYFPVAINVPIGTSNVAASREALQFDKGSLERVHAALIPIANEFASLIVDRLTKPKRFFERIDLAKTWFKKVSWEQSNVRQLLSATQTDARLDSVIDAAYSRTTKIDPQVYPAINFVRIDAYLQEGMYKLTQRRSFKGLDSYSGLQSMRRKLNNHLNETTSSYSTGVVRRTPWVIVDKPISWELTEVKLNIYNKELPDMSDTTKSTKEAWPFINNIIVNGDLKSENERKLWLTPAAGVSHEKFLEQVMELSDELGLSPRSFVTPPEPPKEVNARPEKTLMGLRADMAYSDSVKKASRVSIQRSGVGNEIPADEPIICVLYDRKAQHSYSGRSLQRIVDASKPFTSNYTWDQLSKLVGLPAQDHIYFVPEDDWEDIVEMNPDAMNWDEVKELIKNDPIMYDKVFKETNKPAGESLEYPMSRWLHLWRNLMKDGALDPIKGTLFDAINERWNIEADASDDYNRAMRLRKEANQMFGWTMPTGHQLDRNKDFKELTSRYPLLVHAISSATAKETLQYIEERELVERFRAGLLTTPAADVPDTESPNP